MSTMAPTVVDVKSVQLMPWTILAPVFLAGVCLVDIVMDLVCGRVAGLCACARVWLCVCVWLCVWLCVAVCVCFCVWLCVCGCVCVWLCVCGCVWLCGD